MKNRKNLSRSHSSHIFNHYSERLFSRFIFNSLKCVHQRVYTRVYVYVVSVCVYEHVSTNVRVYTHVYVCVSCPAVYLRLPQDRQSLLRTFECISWSLHFNQCGMQQRSWHKITGGVHRWLFVTPAKTNRAKRGFLKEHWRYFKRALESLFPSILVVLFSLFILTKTRCFSVYQSSP